MPCTVAGLGLSRSIAGQEPALGRQRGSTRQDRVFLTAGGLWLPRSDGWQRTGVPLGCGTLLPASLRAARHSQHEMNPGVTAGTQSLRHPPRPGAPFALRINV